MRHRYFKWVWMVFIVFLCTGPRLPVAAQEKKPAQDKAAVVNGEVISTKHFERELRRVRQQMADRGRVLSDSELAAVRKELLEALINRELLLQESRRQNMTVTDAEVEAQLQGLKKRFHGDADFNKAMEEMGTSEAEIKSQIRQEWR